MAHDPRPRAARPAAAATPGAARGRGAASDPANRFETLHVETEPEWQEWARNQPEEVRTLRTRYLADRSRDVLAENRSPDIPFRFGLNPYRGCEHGCIYCYARPSHEYLGWSAGLDFESRILVKPEAPALLARRLGSRAWEPQVVALSGNTDCYQPAERRLELTRQCLAVFLRHRNPVSIITKNDLVLRDLDLLGALAERRLVRVTLSVTSLDAALQRRMEPRTSPPARRLEAIARLAAAGIPVGVNMAPVIPGLNDHELPAILAAAAERGAAWAGYIVLRLPGAVEGLFVDWLERCYPERKDKVLAAIREVRAGALNDVHFGRRMRGQGVRAETIARLFDLHCRRLGLNRRSEPMNTGDFRRDASRPPPAQGELFDDLPD